MTILFRHSERSEELILFKTNFDYCFTPSSRSFRFAIRKTFIHFFGATSDWVRLTRRPTQNLSWISFSKNSRSFRNRSHSLCFSLLRVYVHFVHIRPTEIRKKKALVMRANDCLESVLSLKI